MSDYQDKVLDAIKYFEDYKAGRLPQGPEPEHSATLRLANNPRLKEILTTHFKFQKGNLEGLVTLDEFLKGRKRV